MYSLQLARYRNFIIIVVVIIMNVWTRKYIQLYIIINNRQLWHSATNQYFNQYFMSVHSSVILDPPTREKKIEKNHILENSNKNKTLNNQFNNRSYNLGIIQNNSYIVTSIFVQRKSFCKNVDIYTICAHRNNNNLFYL